MGKFTEQHLDVLRELINIGVGKGASILNTMLNAHINLQIPIIKIISKNEIEEYIETYGRGELAAVNLSFKGKISGSTKLIFPTESAENLVAVFTGEAPGDVDLDSIRMGTLSEIGNIVINSLMGSISNLLHTHFTYTVPNYIEGNIEKLLSMKEDEAKTEILLAKTRFTIDKLEIVGNFLVFLEVGSFENLLSAIENFMAIE